MKISVVLKATALLLILTMLPLISACSEMFSVFDDMMELPPEQLYSDKGDSTQEGQGKVTEDETTSDFSEGSGGGSGIIEPTPYDPVDFDGLEICVLYRNNSIYSKEWYSPTASADDISEAVEMRNNAVCEAIDLSLKFKAVPSEDIPYFITNDINSNLHEYDFCAADAHSLASVSLKGCASDLKDSEAFPFFDYDTVVWNQSLVKNTTQNGRLYFLTGLMQISNTYNTPLIWTNLSLSKKYEIENMQEKVFQGEWTYEELYRLSQIVSGDTELGFAVNERSKTSVAQVIPYAWDFTAVKTADDGTHSFAMNESKALMIDAFFRSLLFEQKTSGIVSTSDFMNGRVLFIADNFDSYSSFSGMDDANTFLPLPKYDAMQDSYYTSVANPTVISVLDHSNSTVKMHGDAVSAFLQLSAEIGYTTDPVFNLITNMKYLHSDIEDSKTLHANAIAIYDIIIQNTVFDLVSVYSSSLNNISSLWNFMTVSDNISFSSQYAQNELIYNQALTDLDVWFGLRPSPPGNSNT